MGKVTIGDVAAAASVSKATVSRVLNGRVDVSGETAERVREAIEALGFVKDRRALNLATGRSDAIGIVAPSSTDDWMIEVLRGAMQAAQKQHLNIMLLTYPETTADQERLVSMLAGRAVDGVLVVQPRERLSWLEALQAQGLPVAVLDDHGSNPGVDAFVPDESTGIAAAAEHLATLGRRDIALLTGPGTQPTLYTTRTRRALYTQELARRGLKLRPELVVPTEYSLQGGEMGVAELLRHGRHFDALIASSDAMAVGAMRALRVAGLMVPRAVSVIGFDDFQSATYTDPSLTTVHNPLFEMSSRAIDRLTGRSISDAASPIREVVPTHLIVRDSTGPTKTGGN